MPGSELRLLPDTEEPELAGGTAGYTSPAAPHLGLFVGRD